MPMTTWEDIAGYRCACGEYATHWFGDAPLCCQCHGGDMISREEATGRHIEIIRGRLELMNPDALLADGFDEAIVGVCYRACQSPVVAYDMEMCIRIMQRQGLAESDALEYLEANTFSAWVGEGTPVFLKTVMELEDA